MAEADGVLVGAGLSVAGARTPQGNKAGENESKTPGELKTSRPLVLSFLSSEPFCSSVFAKGMRFLTWWSWILISK